MLVVGGQSDQAVISAPACLAFGDRPSKKDQGNTLERNQPPALAGSGEGL